ncbi:hypothetical protein BJF93_15185 [Xaviernesmea oryzae]|uniref:Uncharacterized protein n=1 Tax=Xaviernesmea oryzae TaxID=464029 RepID=A0A1Q9AXZ1_9HYPH|nr:HAD family hydrolase [Xaviernesmea oryzae]OLP60300.1 hypothetical protein BJF93_15185 [Xaviernesmea oryzae]SEK24264.1 Haloacid dehalogenase-like hydrolase [Xaviernesmea oryzae]
MKAHELEFVICRKVDEIIAAHGHAYVGFDIFDTLIGRTIPKEIELTFKCRRLAKKLLGSEERHAEIFGAYERAYHASCQRNTQIGLDYEVLTPDLFRAWVAELKLLDLTIDEEQLYAELEAAEFSVCVALPYARRLLDKLKKKKATLFFLSDMYMGKRVVEPLLKFNNLFDYFDFGHVSSDVGQLKRTGSLFKRLLEDKQWDPARIVFIGDDQHADVHEPAKLGFQSIHYFVDDVEAERADLRAHFDRAQADAAFLPAALYRALCGFKFQSHSVEDVSVSKYLGPFFANFAHRIEETIAELGVHHVLFAAREGLFLRKVVEGLRDQTAQRQPSRTATFHYFPSSRLTSLQFGLSEKGIGLREMVGAISNGGNTLRHLLSFLSASEEELDQIAQGAGISSPDQVLHSPLWDWSPFQRVVDLVNESEALARLRKEGDRFESFMQQQGILDGTTKLFIDLGWSAQIQENLSTGLDQRAYPDRLVGLYAGTTLKAHWKVTPRNSVRWHFADIDNRSALPHPILWYPHILENLSRSPHGSCIGFDEDDEGIVRPVTKVKRDPQEERDDLLISKIQTSILGYTARYGALCEAYGLSASAFRELIIQLMFKFLVFPDKEVARLYSSVSNVSDFGSDEVLRSAAIDGVVGVDDDAVEHIAGRALWPQAVTAASLGASAALKRAMTIERHRWPKPDRPFASGMTQFNSMPFEADQIKISKSPMKTAAYVQYEGWVSSIWERAQANAIVYSAMEFRLEAADLPTHFLTEAEFSEIQEIDRQICSGQFFDETPLPLIADHAAPDTLKVEPPAKHKRFIAALSALIGMQNQQGSAKLEAAEQLNRERLAAIRSMENLIKERDAAIEAMTKMIDERWNAMQNMELMIRERDETIVAMKAMIDERWDAMQEMGRLIAERDAMIERLSEDTLSRQ